MVKRVEIDPGNLSPCFIGSWCLESLDVCDQLIEFFDNNPSLHRTGEAGGRVDVSVKNSLDLSLTPRDLNTTMHQPFLEYFQFLYACHSDYIQQWPFLESIACKVEIGRFNIQKYCQGQHFKKIHTERSSIKTLHRLFAFMTYLNDVEEGGNTSFLHYGIDIKPQKGITLIWPAEWTHAHCGNEVIKGNKYIITGWLDFCI